MSNRTLIEKSIVINGIGRSDAKTIFTIEKEEEKMDRLYRSLDKISGRTLSVFYKYLEEEVESKGMLKVQVPIQLNEQEVKDFILAEISKSLAV